MSDQPAAAAGEQAGEGTDVDFEQGGESARADIPNQKILGVPVDITVSVGNARLSVKDLLNLEPDTIVPLDTKIDDPVEIYIGERLIARGELVEAEEGKPTIGVRLVEICNDAA